MASAEKQGDTRKVKEFKDQLEGEKLKLSRIESDADRAQLLKNGQGADFAAETSVSIATGFKDVLSEHLDEQHGSSVTDKDIYRYDQVSLLQLVHAGVSGIRLNHILM